MELCPNSKCQRNRTRLKKFKQEHLEISLRSTFQGKIIYYKDIDDLKSKIKNLKTVTKWDIKTTENEITITLNSEDYEVSLPYLSIIFDDGLGYTIKVFGWSLPEDIYTNPSKDL